jgi:hypothetical protein
MHRTFTMLALAALAAACETSTAPDLDAPFDTEAALADYQAIEGLLASSDWAGFRALSGRTPFSGSPAGVEIVSALGVAGSSDDARSFAADLATRLATIAARSETPSRAPIISDTHRGATFVYDPDTDRYVVDPDRAGAPATGVRFVIYDLDGDGRPDVGQEIGYADLVDEGDGSAEDVVLHLTVVVGETTVLDYRTTVDVGLTWGAITVNGFLQGEGDVRLDFDIEAKGTRTLDGGTLDVTFEIGVASRDFYITGSVSGAEGSGQGSGSIELTVRHGSHEIRAELTGEAGQLDGSLFLNGELFATVTGAADNPTILSADGDPLTFGEQLVLHHVVDTVEDVFDFLEDLVDPVDELVLVGIIL